MIKKRRLFIPFLLIVLVGTGCKNGALDLVDQGKNKIIQTTQQIRFDLSGSAKEHAMIEGVPFIQQLPELRRGCEVTSLTMLLQYNGIQTDKMKLAKEIERVPFKQNQIHGNPNDGFVGDIYSTSNPGYGVYHKPIYRLAQTYAPNKVMDLTGRDIADIYKSVSMGSPVWVITNTTFEPLPDSEFETWSTKDGDVKITYHEHSVVIVGYDNNNVYVQDPLADGPKSAIPRDNFEKAWEQMGKQAIAIIPKI
ncbi:C39 family peptidase [Ectobacillus sp. sgz5001026]|uniref:C39 family peptidase n=1 Tax=Ectobacillus sp. sgz5001026 TaxID=3242473 RepID=UPI0036D28452